jgi:two-component system response regulator MprA
MAGAPTILVVDDDADVRASVANALEAEGYQVLGAANGREALNFLSRGDRPDAILLDMMMPEMDGWAFRSEQMRIPELAAIPVVIFSAHGIPAETANQLGAAGFLKKPVGLDKLLEAVGRVAGRVIRPDQVPS